MGWFRDRDGHAVVAEGTTGRTPADVPALEQLEQRVAALEDETRVRLNRQLRRLDEHKQELDRIGPQVAALEARLEQVRKGVEAQHDDRSPEAADPGSTADQTSVEASGLLTEVRRQHEQVRARISAAARYEERLRRVEDRLAETTAGVAIPEQG